MRLDELDPIGLAPPEHLDVRRIASEWHGGQGSALYSLSSSGYVDAGAIRAECVSALKGARLTPDAGEGLQDSVAELCELHAWADAAEDALSAWEAEAQERGAAAARNAASWAADGNTPAEGIRRVLAMLDDGDPEAEAYLPRCPNLSGEWADDATPLSLAREITGAEDVPDDVIDALAEAWEAGVAETFEEACEAALRAWLPAEA